MPAVDKRLLRESRSAHTFLALCVAAGCGQAALILAQAWLLATILTDAFLRSADWPSLRGRIVWFGLVFLGRSALGWLAESAAHRASAGVKSELRLRLLAHVVRLGPRWLTDQRSGELTTLATHGIDALDPYFARYLPQLVLAALVPLAVMVRLALADWLSAAIVLVTLPLIPIFMVLVGMASKRMLASRWTSLRTFAHHFLDVLSGLGTLKAFDRSRAQVTTIRQMADQQRRDALGTLRIAFLSSLVLELLATVSVALVAVSIGLRLVSGNLDLATALLVLILAPEAYLPLRQVGANYHASTEGLAAANEVYDALSRPAAAAGDRVAPDPARQDLRLADVTVESADRDRPAVVGASYTFAAGRVTGLVGESGSGKSTILALLAGLVRPDSGRVLVGRTDLASVEPSARRERTAWLTQDPVLFAGTVEDNIRLGRPDAPGRDVEHAARSAAVDVPLDLEVGEHGNGLSAGQRRRVALARALLVDAPLLLLDEPTEGVDPETEAILLTILPPVLACRTVVLVTHREALLDLCDEVLVVGTATAVAA